ncbi:GNAT family N-acetyltransferase [Aestuariivirga sp.]|uniref:GNAT family N-acetyltransferase n=1 Tax=Aestuariivirga sp. TaxID=2650926 RepID=UPI0039193179
MNVSLAPADRSVAPHWRALAAEALGPSCHNLPDLVLPALAGERRAVLATVREDGALKLAFPLLPPRVWRPWFRGLETPVNYPAVPHLAREGAVPALTAFLDALPRPLLLGEVATEGPFWDALMASSAQVAVLRRWQRAVVRPRGSFAAWYDANFDGKRRYSFRRKRAKLSELGQVVIERQATGENLDGWLSAFFDLEAKGWKGHKGTALKFDARACGTLREAMPGLAAAGKLRLWCMKLDDRPIAMMSMIVDGGKGDILKVAYDEDFARVSPGVLLLLAATEDIFAEGLALADCCAIPDHPMYDHVWRDRLGIADVMVAGPGVPSALFNGFAKAERLRRDLRGRLKKIYYRVAGITPS